MTNSNVYYNNSSYTNQDFIVSTTDDSKRRIFNCSKEGLLSLKGQCPIEVFEDMFCDDNCLTSLEGCPRYVGNIFSCKNNVNLKDISNLPKQVCFLRLENCPNVEIFTKEIENNRNNILSFDFVTEEVRQRIKEWKYYEVVKETDKYIEVKIKSLGQRVIDDI